MKKEPEIILASGSPRRKELLEQIGCKPRIMVSDADENLTLADPSALVLELSRRKCLDVAGKVLDETRNGKKLIVLGADTVVSVDGTILGKPVDEENAKEMLQLISGRSHEVLTGVYLVLAAEGKILKEVRFEEETKVFVDPLTEEEILAYIKTKEPMDKAGAYGIQGIFGKHVSRIEGDYYNVVGLPIAAVYQAIKRIENEL